MKKAVLTILAVVFSMIISTHLFAMERECGWGHGTKDTARQHEGAERGHRIRYMAGQHGRADRYAFFARLNLTSEQKAEINELHLANMKEIKPLHDQLYSKRGDLRLLWLQPTPDKEKILAVQKDIRNIRDQIADRATALRVDAYNILTPEQKEKAKAFFSVHRFGPGGGHEGMTMHQ